MLQKFIECFQQMFLIGIHTCVENYHNFNYILY